MPNACWLRAYARNDSVWPPRNVISGPGRVFWSRAGHGPAVKRVQAWPWLPAAGADPLHHGPWFVHREQPPGVLDVVHGGKRGQRYGELSPDSARVNPFGLGFA